MVRAFFPGSFDPIHYGHVDIAELKLGKWTFVPQVDELQDLVG